MTTYVIGDVQGCYRELMELLELVNFSSENDRLWFTGDLVNRGPDSLSVLRFVKDLGNKAATVLGNHDLHMLAVVKGFESPRPKDTLEGILSAHDKLDLIDWVLSLPLMHIEDNNALVHAGIYPGWDLEKAKKLAEEVEGILRSNQVNLFFKHMYGDTPKSWRNELAGWDRYRFITNCFTRMRYCTDNLELQLTSKGPPGTQPAGLIPWYDLLEENISRCNIFFGHWSTLGLINLKHVFSLDTGCLWGGKLSAISLEDTTKIFQMKCRAKQNPH